MQQNLHRRLRNGKPVTVTHLALHRLAHKVDSPETGVFVAGVERLERVAKVGLSRVVGQVGRKSRAATVRTIPRTDDRARHHHRDIVGARPAAPFDGDGDVSEWHVIVTDANLGT